MTDEERARQFHAILSAQNELRLRLDALDREIALFEAGVRGESTAREQTTGRPIGVTTADVAAVASAPLTGATADPPAGARVTGGPPPLPVPSSLPPAPAAGPGVPPRREPDRPPAGAVGNTGATPPSKPPQPLELRLGSYWLVRIGVVVLITGLVFLGNYVYKTYVPHLGPAGKLTMIGLAGTALAAAGAWCERRRAELKNYGHVLLGGGLATLYYAGYASHFVPRLRVIESPVVAGVLLLLLTLAIVWMAERRRSQTVALLAVLLSYYTAAMNPVHGFALASNLLLTAAAVYFLIRNDWARLTLGSLVASYAGFGFWRVLQGGEIIWGTGLEVPEFWFSRAFLTGYWLLFTVGFLTGGGRRQSPILRTIGFTVNNAAFFGFTAPPLDRFYPDHFWIFCMAFGGVLVALAWWDGRRTPADRLTEGSLLAQGLALITIGIVSWLTGFQVALVLAAQSLMLILLGDRIGRQRLVFHLLAAAAAVLAIGKAVTAWDLNVPLSEGVTCLAMAAIFAAASWAVRRKSAAGDPFRRHGASAGYALAMVICGIIGVVTLFHRGSGMGAAFSWVGGIVILSAIQRWCAVPEAGATSRLWLIPALTTAAADLFDGKAGALGVAAAMVASSSAWRHGLPATAPARLRRVGGMDLGAALTLYLMWGWDRIPADWRLTFFAASGVVIFLAGLFRRWRGLVWMGAATLAVAIALFAMVVVDDTTNAIDAIVPALLLAAHQIGKRLRRADPDLFPPAAQAIMLIAMVGCAFSLVARECAASLVTVGWSVLGCGLFALGFVLRERLCRVAGLAVLGAAVVRVFVRDVWHLDTGARIASFLVLGVALLGLGFVYNRFQERIRQWL